MPSDFHPHAASCYRRERPAHVLRLFATVLRLELMIRLIRGATGTGKTALVFREFKDVLRKDRRDMRLVVPTATLVRHFQHELARDGVVFPPASVISLSSFARQCAAGSEPIPDGLLRAIVRDALRRIKPAEFAEVAASEGMAATILDTIALFENAAWTPGKLAAVRKLNSHSRAFQKVWDAIDSAVAGCGYQTRGGMFRAAIAPPGSPSIWMDGFVNLSPLESEFVTVLAKACDLTITLADTPATHAIRVFAMQLKAQDRLLPGVARRPEIAPVAAPNMEREADEIARRILRFHEQGIPFREIGVALREPDFYKPLLQGTFDRFGIPARFYFSTPLRQHPAATFLSGLIDCVLNGWEFGAALGALQSHPDWGQSSSFDRFDFKVREAMPGKGAAELLALAEDFGQHIGPCFALDAWRDQQVRPREWARRLEEMARSLYRPGLIDPAFDRRALDTARSQSAALSAWVKAVTSAAGFWTDTEKALSLGDFWLIAQEVIEGASFRTPDDRRDVVHVMSAFEARQWDVSALFVCGMTDRDFPRRNPQNLLFPDSDIEALRLPIRKASDRDKEEKDLWDVLKTRAQHKLIVTSPQHDAGGRSVQSSRWLSDADVVIGDTSNAQLCRATPTVVLESAGLPGRIDSSDLLAALTTQHRQLSITNLEDMMQCRFKFFAGRTLSLKPRPERPQERLSKRVFGLVLHKALEAWLNTRRTSEFIDHFETAFDEMRLEKNLPPGFVLEAERIFLRDTARKINTTEQWTPLSSLAEVELALEFPGGVRVNGRVDRIDRMSDTECVIVDYKSGGVGNVEKLVESTARLQGPLYALAAKERLNLRTIAMMYVAVREDKRFGWGDVPGAELELKPIPPNWMEDARDRSVERLSSFLSGALQADPAELDGCRWCDYKEACRVEQRQALVMIEGAQGG
jgi:RecB family exonuclease